MRRFLLGTLALTATLLSAGAALGATPVGAEFQVNTYTTGWQSLAAVAAHSSGGFVVVWSSDNYPPPTQDGSGAGVFGQRYDSAGNQVGSEFQVNTYTTSSQSFPAVAADGSGRFVVVWGSGDGSSTGVFGQRFDSEGGALGSEFQVNTYTTSYQSSRAVAADSSGGFVVVWASGGQDGSFTGIFGQRFDSEGGALGSEFQVNTYTISVQTHPAVAMNESGGFVVVWDSYQDGSYYGVFGQRFDSAGAKLGSEFQVNSYTTDQQQRPSVAVNADGDFLVVWHSGYESLIGGPSELDVFGQLYGSAGSAVGGEFQVNTYTTGVQYGPAVAPDGSGGFVVVWTSDPQSRGVFGQRFNSVGGVIGSEFQVNTYTTGVQYGPAVAPDGSGGFVVVWQSSGLEPQDGSLTGVFGQRFLPEPSQMVQLGSCIALLLALARRRGAIGV